MPWSSWFLRNHGFFVCDVCIHGWVQVSKKAIGEDQMFGSIPVSTVFPETGSLAEPAVWLGQQACIIDSRVSTPDSTVVQVHKAMPDILCRHRGFELRTSHWHGVLSLIYPRSHLPTCLHFFPQYSLWLLVFWFVCFYSLHLTKRMGCLSFHSFFWKWYNYIVISKNKKIKDVNKVLSTRE